MVDQDLSKELKKNSVDMEKPQGMTIFEVGEVKDEYGPWMLVEQRKQGSRQGPTRPKYSKQSVGQARAFYAKCICIHSE